MKLIHWLTSTNKEGKNVPKILFFSGLAVFALMSVLAWILYKERMLNFDPAFFSFLLINEEWFSPVLGRYGTILSQLLPYTAMLFGADLATILKLYSLSFVLLYAIYLVIIGAGFKDKEGVFAICIALTLTFRETFYYSTAELYQAIGLSVVLWSLFKHLLDITGKRQKIALVFTFLLIIGISFFHQLGLFTVLFVLIAEYVRRNNWRNHTALITIAFALIWFVFRIKFLTVSAYEQEKLLTIETFTHYLFKLGELESYQYFRNFYHGHLSVPLLASIVGIILLLIERKWMLAVFIPAFTIAFWLVIIIGMNRHESPIMFQNYYTVFGLFIGVLLAIALNKSNIWIVTLALVGLSFYSLKEIYQSRYDFKNRTEFVQNLSEYGNQFPEGKYIINGQNIPWDYVWISWALPFETMISSEINPGQTSVTFFPTFEPDTLKDRDIIAPHSFLGPEFNPGWFNISSLNQKYFHVKVGVYRMVNTLQTEQLLTDSFLTLNGLKIIPEADNLNKSPGSTSVKIILHNETQNTMASIPITKEGVMVYLNIINNQGDTIRKEKQWIILDVPVNGFVKQSIKYNHPSGENNVMDIGYYRERDKSYFSKAKVILGN